MSGRVAALAGVAAGLVFVAACAQSPTAPTPVTPGLGLGSASQEPAASPAIAIPAPPQVLGATRFLAFGDSITAGVQSSFDGAFLFDDLPGSYPSRLRGLLSLHSAAQAFSVTNEGLPGEYASAGERRLQTVLASRMGASVPLSDRPQALLLLEGINDMNGGGVSATRAASSLAQLVQIGRLYNLTVLVATMPQTYESVDPNGVVRGNAAEKIVPFNAELRRLVNGLQNVYIVDLFAAFGSNRSLMGGDGLHPTPAGYQVMAEQFKAAIVQRFPVRGGLQ